MDKATLGAESFPEGAQGVSEEEGSRLLQKGKEISPSKTANHTIKIAIVATLAALSVALSTAVIFFPYIELMTVTLFIGGIILGPIYACMLALLSASLYEIIATILIGPGFIIFPFKVIAFLLIALTGSFVQELVAKRTTMLLRLFLSVVGGLLTITFDLLTNIGWIILSENFNAIAYFTALAIGLPVTASKVMFNALLFFTIPEIYNRGLQPLLFK